MKIYIYSALFVIAFCWIMFAVIPSYFGCLNSGGAPVEGFGIYNCAVVK